MTDVVTGSGNGSTQGYWPFIGHFELLLLNKFFDPSTPSIRKGRDGEKIEKRKRKKNSGENSGPLSSLPVDSLTATDCKADRSC